ncbi:hypothetical protein TWF694_000403 [Orbilia ellipsospora]|uniref:F-box domain-containing protein n=1 Tax=Orbilia ellipsospora TaxID=2528407 RepID=A0AAV9XV55_9PEZI
MSAPSPFARLPYELVREIALHLDKASIKSLRLAYPTPRTCDATSKLLFDSAVLRLGTLEWSDHGAGKRLSYLDCLPDFGSESVVFTKCTKLVLHTRYPFIVNAKDCTTYHQRIEKDGEFALADKFMLPFKELLPEQEEACFIELLRRFLKSAKGLRLIEWRTSEDLSIDLHKSICSALCTPANIRNYTLDVSITVFAFREESPYLDALANVQYLGIKVSSTSRDPQHGLQQMREAGKVVSRCPRLKGFEFYSQASVFAYETSESLRSELNKTNELEVFKIDSNLGFTHDMNWSKLGKVKELWASVEGSVTHKEDLEELYAGFMDAGTNLNILSIERYTEPTHEYLLNCRKTLQELDIWGSWNNVELADGFWDEVIPKHAPTLRRLSIQNQTGLERWMHTAANKAAWSWYDYTTCKSKVALPKCKMLEEVTIAFCEGRTSWITEMTESLVAACPGLHTINITFFLDPPANAGLLSTLPALESWASSDKIFNGRSLRIQYEDASKGAFCFPKQTTKGTVPPLWFDKLVQSWRLTSERSDENPETLYRFVRLDDEYHCDDKYTKAKLSPF